MTQSKTTILAVVVAILIIAGLWWGLKDKQSGNSVADNLPDITLGETTAENPEPGEAKSPGGFWSNLFGGGDKNYLDTTSKFTFSYPKDYSVKEIPAPAEGEARTLLLSKGENAPSVQVAVSPFDEEIVLTIERIETDVPDLEMKNPQAIDIAGTKGVKFESDAGVNVWFIAKGNLFQLTAFSAEVGVLDEIVSSFKI